MTDGQSDVQAVNESIDAAMDDRGPKDKARRVMDRLARYLGNCDREDSCEFLRDIDQDEPVYRDLTAIIAEPDHRREMLANVGDEETVRGLVAEAEAENVDCVRLNVGLLSGIKAAAMKRLVNGMLKAGLDVMQGDLDFLIDEFTEKP